MNQQVGRPITVIWAYRLWYIALALYLAISVLGIFAAPTAASILLVEW